MVGRHGRIVAILEVKNASVLGKGVGDGRTIVHWGGFLGRSALSRFGRVVAGLHRDVHRRGGEFQQRDLPQLARPRCGDALGPCSRGRGQESVLRRDPSQRQVPLRRQRGRQGRTRLRLRHRQGDGGPDAPERRLHRRFGAVPCQRRSCRQTRARRQLRQRERVGGSDRVGWETRRADRLRSA